MSDTEPPDPALHWLAANLAWSGRLAELRLGRTRPILVAVEAYGPSIHALPSRHDRVA
jgi:hypothetical protein